MSDRRGEGGNGEEVDGRGIRLAADLDGKTLLVLVAAINIVVCPIHPFPSQVFLFCVKIVFVCVFIHLACCRCLCSLNREKLHDFLELFQMLNQHQCWALLHIFLRLKYYALLFALSLMSIVILVLAACRQCTFVLLMFVRRVI